MIVKNGVKLFSYADLGALLNIKKEVVRNYCKQFEINKYIFINKRKYLQEEELKEFLTKYYNNLRKRNNK